MSITQEQEKTLVSFADKRDALLADIKAKTQEYEALVEKSNSLSESISDMSMQKDALIDEMNGVRFSIGELEGKRAELDKTISKEIANLDTKKSVLLAELRELTDTKRSLENLVAEINNSVTIVSESVSSVIDVSNQIKGEILSLLATFKNDVATSSTELQAFRNDILAVAKQNVDFRAALDERERVLDGREQAVNALLSAKK